MVIMSSKVDRLHTARRFCQLYAGGWSADQAAKLAGAEARRVSLRDQGGEGLSRRPPRGRAWHPQETARWKMRRV